MKLYKISFLAACILMSVTPANAARQSLVYEVYAGGIHAVQATLTIETGKKGRYDIVLDAKTRGFLGSVAPWEGTFESHGWMEKDGTLRPELHKSTANWRGEQEIKEYVYTRDGGFEGLYQSESNKVSLKKEDVAPELTKGTTDALSATLEVLIRVAEGKECAGTSEVFDGKRRFEQSFKHQGYAELEPTKYNIFKGQAAECTVEVSPVGGEWHDKPRGWMSIQEQGRERGTMPTVWAAQLEGGAPAVPVKIRVKTAYGTLFMHLAEFRDGKRTVSAEKRAEP